MKYTITGADAVTNELWQEKSIYILAGGWKLDKTNLRSTLTELPKGALLSLNFTTRVAYLVKTAEVYENLAPAGTSLKVKKTNQFNANDYIAWKKKSVQISTVDTSNALYDLLTLGEALSAVETINAGEILWEAASATTDFAVKSSVTLTDDDYPAETLTVENPEGVNGLKVVIEQSGSDALSVDYNSRVLTISLAKTTASKNTAALIQAAIRAKEVQDGYNFKVFTCTAGGDWDTNAIGDTLSVASGFMANGTLGVDVAPVKLANAINYFGATIDDYPAVTALGAALEIKEANLPYPVPTVHKTNLNSNGRQFMFITDSAINGR